MVDGRSTHVQEYLLSWLERHHTEQLAHRFHSFFDHVPDQPWMNRGACTQSANPDAWFPSHGGVAPETALALKVCRTLCPVQRQCLDYALSRPVEGIWGGTTTKDRNRHLRDTAPTTSKDKS